MRLLPSVDSPPIFQSLPVPPPPPSGGSSLSDAVIDHLNHLDAKLDTILSLLSRDLIRDDFPLTAQVSEISGAGVKLVTDHGFSAGQPVEVVLVLSRMPLRLAGATGMTVRQEAPEHVEHPGLSQWVVDFARIREPDLEAIVQFVFSEQRQHIREKRWS